MSELLRVYRKKTILLLIVLSVINFALFLFSATTDKEISLTDEALEHYIDSYPTFLEQTAENSRLLASMSLNKSRYALDVLNKSADAYARLENVTPQFGENRGVVLLLQYRISDLFLLAFLMFLAADFLAERKKGLVGLVRSTIGGRGKLYLRRVVILALSAVFASLLFYGGNFLGMLISFGRTDFSRCIQSLPEFLRCPYRISIGEYVILSVGLKAAVCFAAALIFLMLISILDTSPAYVTAGLLTMLSILTHALVAPVSTANILRYLNLYTLMGCQEFFEDCCFINFFGNALPALGCALLFLGMLTLFLAGIGCLIHGRRYVSNRKFGKHLSDRLAAFSERFAPQRSLIRWEGYKIIIKQGGLAVLIAIFAMHFYMSAQYPYLYIMDYYEKMWYDMFHGDITEERLDKAEWWLATTEDSIANMEKSLEELRQALPVNQDRVSATMQGLAQAEERLAGLLPVIKNMRDGMEYTRRTGNTVRLMVPYTYDLLIERDEKTRERASFFILIGIIAMVSGVFVYESENHMKDSIRTAYRGRCQTTVIKIGIALGLCAICCVALHLIQLYQIGKTIDYNDLSAPIQSLPFMREFGPYITILQYLILLFAVRALVACAVGVICLIVSRLCSDTITALGVSAFILLVPAVFAELTPPDHFISFIRLLSVSNLS